MMGFLAGAILNDLSESKSHIRLIRKTLDKVPERYRREWGVVAPDGHVLTYQQTWHLWNRICKHVGKDVEGPVDALILFGTRMLERQCDAAPLEFSGDVGFDGTIIKAPPR